MMSGAAQVPVVRDMTPALGYRELTLVEQRQYASDELAQRSRWASQQQLSHVPKSSLITDDGASQGYDSALTNIWAKASGLDQITGWDYDAQRVALELNGQYHQNHHLFYDPGAALNSAAARHGSCGGQLSWTPSAMRGPIAGACASISDFDSINSLSPQSYLSDGVDNSFSPCSVSDHASSRGDWITSTSPSVPIKVSSPTSGPSIPHASLTLACNSNIRSRPELVGLSGGTFALAEPSLLPQANNAGHAFLTSFDGAHSRSPGGSLASMAAPESSCPWYMPGYSASQSDAKLTLPNGRAYENDINDGVCVSCASNPRSSSSCESPPCKASPSTLHPQVNDQPRLKVARIPSAEVLRQRNDELLLQGKRDGLTYREIRNKMMGEKPAESTLRGRYRSLTKARKDRVRKPVWHKHDVNVFYRL